MSAAVASETERTRAELRRWIDRVDDLLEELEDEVARRREERAAEGDDQRGT